MKGLRSSIAPSKYQSTVQITETMLAFLTQNYGLKRSATVNDDFFNDFRVSQANFLNKTDFCKICKGSFKVAGRKSREQVYRWSDGRLLENFLRPFLKNFLFLLDEKSGFCIFLTNLSVLIPNMSVFKHRNLPLCGFSNFKNAFRRIVSDLDIKVTIKKFMV